MSGSTQYSKFVLGPKSGLLDFSYKKYALEGGHFWQMIQKLFWGITLHNGQVNKRKYILALVSLAIVRGLGLYSIRALFDAEDLSSKYLVFGKC